MLRLRRTALRAAHHLAVAACLLVLAAGGVGAAGPADDPLPELDVLLQRFREGLRANAELFGQYKMRQKITRREREGDGRIKRTRTQVFEVRPNAWGTPAEWILVSEDGKSLSAERIEKARREVSEAQPTSDRDRAKLLVKTNRQHRKMEQTIDEVFRVTKGTIVGRATIDGHSTIEVAFEPRAGARHTSTIGRVLGKSSGRIWISEADHQLVRFEAEAIETILYGWGLVARIHEGTRLEFLRRYIDGSAWLPASYRVTGSVRMLLVRRRQIDSTSEFFEYERIDAGSRESSR